MYKRILRKRILRGLVVSLALFAVIPVMNAAAKPVSAAAKVQSQEQSNGSYIRALMLRSEGLNKKYNLGQFAFGPTKQELAAMNARGVGMNKMYNLGQYAVTPEVTSGLGSPQGTPVASSGSTFEWGSTGIGVGIVALLIAGSAAALTVRIRHQGTLAH